VSRSSVTRADALRFGRIVIAVFGLSLMLGAAGLALAPARYEASSVIEVPQPVTAEGLARAIHMLPRAQQRDIAPQIRLQNGKDRMARVTVTHSSPSEATNRANDLAAALVQVSRLFPPEAKKDTPSLLPVVEQRIAALEKKLVEETGAIAQAEESFDRQLQEATGRLREDERRTRELSRIYGPKHPKMKAAEKTLEESRSRLEMLVQPAAGLPKDSAGYLRDQLDFLKTVAAQLKETPTGTQKIFAAKILEKARPSLRPVWPDRAGTLWLTAFLGLPAGLVAGLFLVFGGSGFRSENDLEETTGYPCAGLMDLSVPGGKNPVDIVLREPSSSFVDGLRALKTVLDVLGMKGEQKTKVLMVTSATKEDASALVSLWLGQLAIRSGQKCLLIDADLRNPSLAALLAGKENKNNLISSQTLADYLSGQAGLEDVLLRRDHRFPHLILGGAVPNTAGERIASSRMETLIRSFRQVYDYVVLNVPAAAEHPDALTLSRYADQILFVVHQNGTDRDQVQETCRKFAAIGQDRLCFVMDSGLA
jgi:Mrp family chromosome partitioning ATPase